MAGDQAVGAERHKRREAGAADRFGEDLGPVFLEMGGIVHAGSPGRRTIAGDRAERKVLAPYERAAG